MKRIIRYFTTSALLVGMTVPAIATGGASDPTQSRNHLNRPHGTVYTMHRPGLRVRLEVRGSKIVPPVQIWALRKCSNGFEGGSGLSLEEPGQGIPIQEDGHFEYKSFIAGEERLTRLSGRVREKTIRGFYLKRDKAGPSAPLCGTGRPGDRALRFVARPK